MLRTQRRFEKLEEAALNAASSKLPGVYLIQSNGDSRTYSITLGGKPLDRLTTIVPVGVAVAGGTAKTVAADPGPTAPFPADAVSDDCAFATLKITEFEGAAPTHFMVTS